MFRYVRVKIAILKGELPLGMSQGWFRNTQKTSGKYSSILMIQPIFRE